MSNPTQPTTPYHNDVAKALGLKRFEEPLYDVWQCSRKIDRHNPMSGHRWTEEVLLDKYEVHGPLGVEASTKNYDKAVKLAVELHQNWRKTHLEQFVGMWTSRMQSAIFWCAKEAGEGGVNILKWKKAHVSDLVDDALFVDAVVTFRINSNKPDNS